MSAGTKSSSGGGSSVSRWAAVLCWTAVAIEGFDVVVLGAGLAVPWGFYAFALAVLIGAAAISVVPGSPVYDPGRAAPLRSKAMGG